MRLDKFVADAAALTRSEARKRIKNGAVRCEDTVIKDISYQVDENAHIFVNDREVTYKKYIYIMMNKPQGVVSATEDKRQKTVLSLLPEAFSRYDLFPAGRLDIDTEGFLLITNDGVLAHNLLSPNKNTGKTYFVRLEKNISDEEIETLRKGVDIGECITKEAKVERICENEINLTITEGKFHQIKRMAHTIGNNVVYLKRLSYGALFLDESLKTGEYRLLTDEETQLLCNVYKKMF